MIFFVALLFTFLQAHPCDVLNSFFVCPVVVFGQGTFGRTCSCSNVELSSSYTPGPNQGQWSMNQITGQRTVCTPGCNFNNQNFPLAAFRASGSCVRRGPNQIKAVLTLPQVFTSPVIESIVGNVTTSTFQIYNSPNESRAFYTRCFVRGPTPPPTTTAQPTQRPTHRPTQPPTSSNPCNVLTNNFNCPFVTFGATGLCRCSNVKLTSTWTNNGGTGNEWHMRALSGDCRGCIGSRFQLLDFKADGTCVRRSGPNQISAQATIPRPILGSVSEAVSGNVSFSSFRFASVSNAVTRFSVNCVVSP